MPAPTRHHLKSSTLEIEAGSLPTTGSYPHPISFCSCKTPPSADSHVFSSNISGRLMPLYRSMG
ncbi:hypothetical protein PVAP13_8NG266601 [Panicum virgatum]|uniref:Uncharacterized protein n=1 Tax=Panicum virgatum TaxID=38727 RepID=A0A8T0PGX2_PANVG|nr:hypothetical protein PVAP13_8NG266601 [Panicum virgatum]